MNGGSSNRQSPTLQFMGPIGPSSSPEDNTDVVTAQSEAGSKCTAAKAKTVIKSIFAQLFSHLGLCLLVIGYSLMGAVIFMALETDNETKTRENVNTLKSDTLNELYNLTGEPMMN